MDWYDIVMLTVLGGATLLGVWKGFAWQLASLGSLVLSYFLALRFSAQLAPVFGTTAPWNRFVAMLVIYLATSLVVWLGFRMVAGFLDRIKLHGFDHQVGGLFGMLKGILLCLAITFFALGLAPTLREHIIASKSGHYISLFLAKADAVMPPEIHQVLDPYLDKLQERLDPKEPFQPNAPLPLEGDSALPAENLLQNASPFQNASQYPTAPNPPASNPSAPSASPYPNQYPGNANSYSAANPYPNQNVSPYPYSQPAAPPGSSQQAAWPNADTRR
ncbi:MAG TPA: CvpA family protein [Pirellulales bacterium]|jgi:membrane protein required for colicin V production